MKTRELLDEYANNYSRIYDLLLRDENSTLIRRFRYENEEIIKELEANIRKEVVEEMIDFMAEKDWHGTGVAMAQDYAGFKGITLQ